MTFLAVCHAVGAPHGPLNVAPDTCSISVPSAGFISIVGASLTVSGTASDPDGNLSGVAVWASIDGAAYTLWGTATGTATWTFSRTLLAADAGSVILIKAIATDMGGKTKESATVSGTISPLFAALWHADA
jgi:hypothetical protein